MTNAEIRMTLEAISNDCQRHLDTPRGQEPKFNVDDLIAWIGEKSREMRDCVPHNNKSPLEQ